MTLSVVPFSEFARRGSTRRGTWVPSPELVTTVSQIIADVRLRGDAALIDYTRRYDDAAYDISKLRLAIPMQDRARASIPPEIADALISEKARIERFHQQCKPADVNYLDADGTRCGVRYRPIDSVALYVHGGPGAGPSAVLMAAVPAKLAGVSRTIVLTPPLPSGVHPAVLFACSLCEIDELYAVGGAHAISGAALGTESLHAVEKIVGSGGAIVTEAKRQLFGTCEMDRVAAPPLTVVLADDGASSEYVVGELLAKIERDAFGPLAVLSESRALLDAVAQLADTLDARSLDGNCELLLAGGRREVFEAIEMMQPDVLIVQLRDPQPIIDRAPLVRTMLVGDMTPAASARYAIASPLLEFLRPCTILENSRERMLGDAQQLAALCDFESLPNHAHAARLRNG
jgi:histidinol dehydrogenase